MKATGGVSGYTPAYTPDKIPQGSIPGKTSKRGILLPKKPAGRLMPPFPARGLRQDATGPPDVSHETTA